MPVGALKNKLNIHSIPNGRAVGPHPRPESQREKHIAQLSIVPVVSRRIESKQRGDAFLIHIEPRDEMVSAHTRRRREWRQKELRRHRRIVPARSASGTGTNRAACARSYARPDSATTSRTRTRCARSPRAGAGSRRGRARLRRSSGGLRSRRRRRRNDNRLWRHDRLGWHHCEGCVGNRLDSHVLQTLSPAVTAVPSASSASRTRPARTNGVLACEIMRRKRIENEEDYQRMHKKRGGDTLPPPLPLAPARYADWRPVVLIYYGVSLGDTPMTFTPAPRATSIA